MSQVSFSQFDRLDPAKRTSDFKVPNGEGMIVTLCYAGQDNAGYVNAQALRNTKNALDVVTQDDAAPEDASVQLARHCAGDRKDYPGHVITGWTGCLDDVGSDVPFTQENCEAFCAQVPRWIFDRIREHACTLNNFFGDKPTPEEITNVAGN